MDVSEVFANHLVNVEYKDIPLPVAEVTKMSILDTLGVIIGASGTATGIKGLVELIEEIDGKKESTILGFGKKAPAWLAAFVNGAMAHCLDYDDVHEARLHPSSSTVPAGVAVAERVGKISGKELITAVALGNDITCRLGYAAGFDNGWHISPVLGIFGAVATSAKLLRLEADKIVDAFGIGLCQSAGTKELRSGVGSNLGGMYPSFPAQGGVLSALMAQKGITGIKNTFEGKAGLFNVYFGGKYDRARLLGGLGKEFEGINVGFKAWPSCRVTHAYIDATLGILSENNVPPDEIEAVTVYVGDHAQVLCEPLEARRHPETVLDAKYSIPFTVAIAATKSNVVISDFSPEGLKDQQVLRLAERVNPEFDRRYNHSKDMPPYRGEVRITTKKGDKYQNKVDYPYGHPSKPLAPEDIVAKFRDCATYAAKAIPSEKVERVIEAVTGLEQLSDVRDVMRMLEC